MKILKESTKSICGSCYKEIPARVYKKGKDVYLEKQCDKHGKTQTLIETNSWVYERLMNKSVPENQVEGKYLMIPITHACNLSCPICFLPDRQTKDLSIEELKRVILDFPGDRIRLSGGEPTLRKDLPEIIAFIKNRGKIASVSTNGIKFSSRNFTQQLKRAGLHYVHFSFNGLKDDSLKSLNGAALSKVKKKALSNLRRENMSLRLSILIKKGVNEKEFKQIFRLCMQNTPQVCSLRVRTVVPAGNFDSGQELLYLSDLIALFSKIIGVPDQSLIDHSLKYSKDPHMPCSLTIDLEKLLLIDSGLSKIKNQWLKAIKTFMYLFPRVGARNSLQIFINKIRRKKRLFDFTVFIRSWPNILGMDLEEMKLCPSRHYVSSPQGVYPFCKAVALNEKNIKL